MNIQPAFVLVAALALGGCAAPPAGDQAWTDVQTQVARQSEGRQEAEAAMALRELLALSVEGAAVAQAKPGGYLRNPATRIGIPSPLLPVAEGLTEAGLHATVLDFIDDMNVAAEITAGKVAPVLRKALAELVIQDALVTMRSDDATAAMRVYQRQSEAQLLAGFEAPMRDSLRRAGGYDSYRLLMAQYAKLPGAQTILFDYELYVRERAVNGMYVAIGEQEAAVRHDPARQTSAVLRRVLKR